MSNSHVLKENGFIQESNKTKQKAKALSALETAKKLEAEKISAGYVWVKTRCPNSNSIIQSLMKPN